MYSDQDFQANRVTLVYLLFKMALVADTRTSDSSDEKLFNDNGLNALHNIVWCLDYDSGDWHKGVENNSVFDKMRKLYAGGRDIHGMREQFGARGISRTLTDATIRKGVVNAVKKYLKQHGVSTGGSVDTVRKQVIGKQVSYVDVSTFEERLDAKTDHLVAAKEVPSVDTIEDLYVKLAIAYTKRFAKYLDDGPDW